ncbi:MAG: hypothetical protein ABSF67_18910 [Roseiarcus sp.]|jgi:hypothetical protein
MMRFWIAGLVLAASVGAAQAQLDLSGAVPPARAGATAGGPPGPTSAEPAPPPRASAEARKPDKNAVDFSVSLASAVGQPLKLNGRDGELTLWGRDRALKIAKLTLVGEVISDPTQKCRIDIVGEQPIEAKSLGRPDGLPRYEAEIPVCTFTFDVVEGAALVPAQNAACVFKAADCRASPGGLWGPDAASLAAEGKAIALVRTHADDAAARLLKTLAARLKGKPEADDVERDEADLVTRGQEICRDYDKDPEHGFCASRMAQVRAAWLKARADKLTHDAKAPD